MMLCGGIIGAVKLIPVIWTSIKKVLNARNSTTEDKNAFGLIALLASVIAIFIAGFIISGSVVVALLGGILTLVLSLLFVIVSARLAGTIGCSNEPVSGMTIASLVIMTLAFVLMGWTTKNYTEILLLFGVFIVTTVSVGGGYMQTQKVNYMIAGFVGVLTVIGTTVLLEPQLRITGSNPPFGLPQANLIATLTSGIMSGDLPWIMIIVGIVMALVFWMLDLPIMTVALGFYLPISTTSIILVGALLKLLINKTTKDKELRDKRVQSGVSLSSGLIAGGSIIGLVGIIFHVTGLLGNSAPSGFLASNAMGLILLAAMAGAIIIPLYMIKKSENQGKAEERE